MPRTLDIHLNVTPERFQFESVPQVPQVPSAAGNVTSNPRGSCDPRMAPGPLRHSRNEHVVHHPTPTPFPIFQIFHMAAPSSSSSGSPKCLGPIPWRPVSSFVCLSQSMQIIQNLLQTRLSEGQCTTVQTSMMASSKWNALSCSKSSARHSEISVALAESTLDKKNKLYTTGKQANFS